MRCMPLEIGEDTREIRRGEDGVKVGIENNPSMNLQALMRATILKRLNENVAACGASEDRQPRYDGRSDEMSGAKFVDAITTAHGGKLREAQLRRQARSQVQLGNEGMEADRALRRAMANSLSPGLLQLLLGNHADGPIRFEQGALNLFYRSAPRLSQRSHQLVTGNLRLL